MLLGSHTVESLNSSRSSERPSTSRHSTSRPRVRPPSESVTPSSVAPLRLLLSMTLSMNGTVFSRVYPRATSRVRCRYCTSPPSRPGCGKARSWVSAGRIWTSPPDAPQSSRRSTASVALFKEPKTRSSRRSVPLLPELVAELLRLRDEQEQRRRKLGDRYHDHDLVLCQEDGKPLHAHNIVRRGFRQALKRAGLPRIRFHDLRHTAATLPCGRGRTPRSWPGCSGTPRCWSPWIPTRTRSRRSRRGGAEPGRAARDDRAGGAAAVRSPSFPGNHLMIFRLRIVPSGGTF